MYKNVLFLDRVEDFEKQKDITSKELCIIKTDFKNLSPLKKITATYPDMEIWLTGENITREKVILANKYEIKKCSALSF